MIVPLRLIPVGWAVLLIVGLAAFPEGSRAADADRVVLIEQGVARATIVTPAAASEVVSFAAGQLQKYLQKISGATLPIHVGAWQESVPAVVLRTARLDEPRQGLECDSFTVKSESGRLFLTGNTDRAVLYAVYAFLESLGAAWLEPGPEGELLPRMPTVVATLDLTMKPTFDLRGMCTYDQGEGRETIDWMGKMRMNLVLHTPPGFEKRGILWMEGTQNGSEHNFALRMGLGPDWHKDPANLQYIAMLNGKRALQSTAPWAVANVETCLSSEEAVQRLLATSLKYLEDHPQVYLFDMRADDIPNNWCECEACRKHAPTDNYVGYVNRLAAEVHKKWPDKKVSLIAYFDSVFPPRDVMPDLSLGNMVLWFAPISRPYRQPLHSAAGLEKTTMEFPRNKASFPATDGGWEPVLLGWRQVFADPILILDYYHWAGDAGARSSYFYTRSDVIAADLKYYAQLGLSGSIGVEPCPLKLPNGWNQYLKARLLWDSSRDVAKLTELAAHFNSEVERCEKTSVIEQRLKRITLWLDYVILRKDHFRCRHGKDADATRKAKADLAAFVDSHRAQILPYYSEIGALK